MKIARIIIYLTNGSIELDSGKIPLEKIYQDLLESMDYKKSKVIQLSNNTIVNKSHIIRIIKEFASSEDSE